MRILYLKGDTPCYNYPKCIREGFSYYKFCKIEMDEDPNETDCIWFVTEGELEVSCNGEKTKILAGNMICFSREAYAGYSHGEKRLLSLHNLTTSSKVVKRYYSHSLTV